MEGWGFKFQWCSDFAFLAFSVPNFQMKSCYTSSMDIPKKQVNHFKEHRAERFHEAMVIYLQIYILGHLPYLIEMENRKYLVKLLRDFCYPGRLCGNFLLDQLFQSCQTCNMKCLEIKLCKMSFLIRLQSTVFCKLIFEVQDSV